MRVTIAQINPTVGDLQGNVRRLQETLQTCCAEMPDLVVFPELYLTGYPPKDLLERAWFITRVQGAVDRVRQISRDYPKTGILFGAPLPNGEKSGRALRNAALLVHNGEIVASRTKMLLPTYDVFDEARYFEPAAAVQVVPFKGERLGIHICEDAWTDPALWDRRYVYDRDPVQMLVAQGATALINISSSPFNVGKERVRYRLVRGHAMRYGIPFRYVNQVGGNDDLLFDGRSLCVDAQGDPIVVMEGFREEVVTVDLAASGTPGGYEPQEETASVYDALVMGTRDYLHKTGFSRAVVGLSGGVDSAVTCALAVAALGRENVLGVSMPSPYSSQGSIDDARRLAENLGIEYRVVPITDVYGAYLEAMQPHFADTKPDVTEENIQARIRGNILMALSNKFGYLVLSTGNKSELAVGYCTLYGDMSGGLAVISDVPKGMVYDLAYYINRDGRLSRRAASKSPLGRAAPRSGRSGQPTALSRAGCHSVRLCRGGVPGTGDHRKRL